jgi:hypothetical protein
MVLMESSDCRPVGKWFFKSSLARRWDQGRGSLRRARSWRISSAPCERVLQDGASREKPSYPMPVETDSSTMRSGSGRCRVARA